MIIKAFFTSLGDPALLLTPTILIKDVTDPNNPIVVVNEASMINLNSGFYGYDFSTYNKSKEYVVRFDGGTSLLAGERYKYAGNEVFVDNLVDSIWDEPVADHLIVGSTGEALYNANLASIYFGVGI